MKNHPPRGHRIGRSPALRSIIAGTIALLSASSTFGATIQETLTGKREFDIDDVALDVDTDDSSTKSLNSHGNDTPVVTRGGMIFYAYIARDPGDGLGYRVNIVRYDNGQTLTKKTVFTGVANNPHHVAATIGIDRDGYIHLAANMHGSTWVYYRSTNPYEIDSFENLSNDVLRRPPGNYVTYVGFYNDNYGKLYATYRQRVGVNGGWPSAAHGGTIAVYDESATGNTPRWKPLGGLNYRKNIQDDEPNWVAPTDPATQNLVFWTSETPADEAHYQAYKIRLHFDLKNWMHITTVFYGTGGTIHNNAEQATHVAYLKTADGVTFLRSNGSTVTSMPAGVNTNDTSATQAQTVDYAYRAIPLVPAKKGLLRAAHVGSDPAGKPIVSFTDAQLPAAEIWQSRVFDSSAGIPPWSKPSPTSFESDRTTQPNQLLLYSDTLAADLGGRLIFSRGSVGYTRSLDFGKTARIYTKVGSYTGGDFGRSGIAALDSYYLRMTGNLRYSTTTEGTGGQNDAASVNTTTFSEGSNMIANGDGEQEGTAGWTGLNSTLINQGGAIYATSRGATHSGQAADVTALLRYHGPAKYTIAGKVLAYKSSNPQPQPIQVTLRHRLGTGAWTYVQIGQIANVSSSWTSFSFDKDIDWAGDFDQAQLYFQGAAVDHDIGVDDVSMRHKSLNLVQNSHFEEGTAGWDAEPGSVSITDFKTGAYSGIRSARASNRSATWHGISQKVLPELLASGSGTYRVRARVRTNVSTSATIGLVVQTVVGGTTQHATYTSSSQNFSTWKVVDGTVTVNWTTPPTSARFYVQCSDATAQIEVDSVMVQKQ